MAKNKNKGAKAPQEKKVVTSAIPAETATTEVITPEVVEPKNKDEETIQTPAKAVDTKVAKSDTKKVEEPKDPPVVKKEKVAPQEVAKVGTPTMAMPTVVYSDPDGAIRTIGANSPELARALGAGTFDALEKVFGLDRKHNLISADAEIRLLELVNTRIVKWDPNDPLTIAVEGLLNKRMIYNMVKAHVQCGIGSGIRGLRVPEELVPLIVTSFADFGMMLPSPTIAEQPALEEGKEPEARQMEFSFDEATMEEKSVIQIRREREIEAKVHKLEQDPSKWPDQKHASDVITSWFTADLPPEGIDPTSKNLTEQVLQRVLNAVIVYCNTKSVPTQVEGITDWNDVPKNIVFRTLMYDIVPETPTMLKASVVQPRTGAVTAARCPVISHLKLKQTFPTFTDMEIADILATLAEIRAKNSDEELSAISYGKYLKETTVDQMVNLIKNKEHLSSGRVACRLIEEIYHEELAEVAEGNENLFMVNTMIGICNLYRDKGNELKTFVDADPSMFAPVKVEETAEETPAAAEASVSNAG